MGINLLTLLKLTQVLDLKMYNVSYSHKTVSYFKNFYIYCNFVFKKIILCFLRLSPDMFDTLIYSEKKLMFFFFFFVYWGTCYYNCIYKTSYKSFSVAEIMQINRNYEIGSKLKYL